MLIKLENVFKHTSLNPLVVIDCRVQVFLIMSKITAFKKHYATLEDPEYEIDSPDYDQLIKSLILAHWLTTLNDPMPWLVRPSEGYTVIVVDDYKDKRGKYWRSKYVSEYKETRDHSQRTDLYYQILDELKLLIANPKCKIPMLREEGFEADDFAGALWREWNRLPFKRDVFFLTVDSDWKQLVGENSYFANAKPCEFRLQSYYEVLRDYFDKGQIMQSCAAISEFKALYGDSSDNLPPGSPRGVIDLVDPFIKPEMDVSQYVTLPCNTNKDHAKRGKDQLSQWGAE